MIKKINGKSVAIPDAELDNFVEKLDCSLEEAVEMWLDDNDYTVNQEQVALDMKAKKAVKVSTIVSAQAPKQKTQRERVLKPDEVKESIIHTIAKALETLNAQVDVTDTRKMITFTLGEEEFKINLTRSRKPKS